jgi:hypothetical protein
MNSICRRRPENKKNEFEKSKKRIVSLEKKIILRKKINWNEVTNI